jgi:hypothetical protein
VLVKPSYPVLSVEELTARIGEFRALIEDESKKGSVDVEAIRQIAREKDLGLVFMTRALRGLGDFDESSRTGRKLRSGTATDVLTPEHTERVLAELDDATRKILGLDQNPMDGALDREEQKSAKELDGFSGVLVRALLEGSTNPFTWQMQDWQRAVKAAVRSQRQREELHASIDRTADFHAETGAGAEAIRWHLHALATSGGGFDLSAEKQKLAGAETSRLRHVPKFLRPRHADPHGQGHLSNAEVQSLLGTDDLAAFAQAKREEARKHAGGDWDAYLAGHDIDGLAQKDDPELRSF